MNVPRPFTVQSTNDVSIVDQGQGPEGALSTTEREELRRLRRENEQLREERDILGKATAFFAKENR